MIGVGDWVVCVDASPGPGGVSVPLIKGEVYQIAAIWGELPHGANGVGLGDIWVDIGVDLVDVPPISPELAYGLHRFRPLEPKATPEPALAEEA